MFIRLSTNFLGCAMVRIMLEHLTSDFLEDCSCVFWAASVPGQNRARDRLSSLPLGCLGPVMT